MDKDQVWLLCFTGLVGWSMHPGYLKPGSDRMNLDQCADLADKMLEVIECRRSQHSVQ